jgi:hypothetical protein
MYSVVVRNLTENTQYYYRVSAYNGVEQRYGLPTYASPDLPSPIGLPHFNNRDATEIIKASIMNASAIHVQWNPPVDNMLSLGMIKRYELEWDAKSGTPELQVLEIRGNGKVSGTFSISLGSQSTNPMASSVPVSILKSELEGLDEMVREVQISHSQVRTEQGYGNTWTITFIDFVGDMPLMTVNSTSLIGDNILASARELRKGRYPLFDSGTIGLSIKPLGSMNIERKYEIQSISVIARADDLHGSFKIKFMSDTTTMIPYNTSANDLKLVLQSLQAIRHVNVTRDIILDEVHPTTPSYGYKWIITFIDIGYGSHMHGDLPSLLVTTSAELKFATFAGGASSDGQFGLKGLTPQVYVREEVKGKVADTSVTIEGLNSKIKYVLRLRTCTALGCGRFVYSKFSLLPTNRQPCPPTSVRTMIVSGREVDVEWFAPKCDGGQKINKYTLEWSTKNIFIIQA